MLRSSILILFGSSWPQGEVQGYPMPDFYNVTRSPHAGSPQKLFRTMDKASLGVESLQGQIMQHLPEYRSCHESKLCVPPRYVPHALSM